MFKKSMGDGTELFRREALHAQTKHLIGEVVLYRPLSFAWLTLVSLVFAAAIIAFLVLASYTRKEEKMVSDPNLLHMADPFCFDVDVRYQHLNK
jgi:membrane fusion protein